jgi:hypothetical protein
MSDRANQPVDEPQAETGAFWRWAGKMTARQYVGWILVAGGAVCILVGYLGISRQALVAKQLPYMISGGIFGLALVGVGTFYLATEQLRHDSGRLDRLEQMVAQLHAVLLTRPDAPAPESAFHSSNGVEPEDPTSQSPTLVALPDARRYHRPGCSMVANKKALSQVSDATIRRRGLEPCDLCEPPPPATLASSSAREAR